MREGYAGLLQSQQVANLACTCYRIIILSSLVRKGYELVSGYELVAKAGAYLDFGSMKQLEVFLLSPGGIGSPSQGYPLPPPSINLLVPIYTPGLGCSKDG